MEKTRRLPGIPTHQWYRSLAVMLVVLIGILYSPSFGAFFQSDDFTFLSAARGNIHDLLNGERWKEWFVDGINFGAFFRPFGNLFWLVNFIAFGVEPFAYHITAVLFHLIASFAALILAHLLTRDRVTASLAAIIFAIMPIHSEAVAWVAAAYDALSGLCYLISVIFYVLYRRRGTPRFYFTALAAFGFALSSKETALTLPVMIFLYDLAYHRSGWRRAYRIWLGYVPFGLIVLIRLLFFGHGWGGLVWAPAGWQYYVDYYLAHFSSPLPAYLSLYKWLVIGYIVAALAIYRSRPAVLYGLAWIAITLSMTFVEGGNSDRSFYIPSFGVSLLFAINLGSLLTHKATAVRVVGTVVLSGLVLFYSVALYTHNQGYARASNVARAIVNQMQELQPVLPPDGRVVFTGVPMQIREGPFVFLTGPQGAVQVAYKNPALRVFQLDAFPLWLDNLERTYFFQVDHTRVSKRDDLIAVLEQRKRCADYTAAAVDWDFTHDSQGWEAWNQLEGLENNSRMLFARSVGNDPYMASPPVDIPALAIGDIEITMGVRGANPTFEGEIHWKGSDAQMDFAPDLKQSFVGIADGELHTYRLDISQTGLLMIGDKISRLRLDPVAAPADIALKSIRVSVHCTLSEMERCSCEDRNSSLPLILPHLTSGEAQVMGLYSVDD